MQYMALAFFIPRLNPQCACATCARMPQIYIAMIAIYGGTIVVTGSMDSAGSASSTLAFSFPFTLMR